VLQVSYVTAKRASVKLLVFLVVVISERVDLLVVITSLWHRRSCMQLLLRLDTPPPRLGFFVIFATGQALVILGC
jgi:hypothetical protein